MLQTKPKSDLLCEFQIPTPPTMNEIIKEARGNAYASNNTKQHWTQLVALACREFGTTSYPVRVEFEFHFSNSRRDPDNILASQKFIFDGMVAAGFLPKDNFTWVKEIHATFHQEKGDDYVVVRCYKWQGF